MRILRDGHYYTLTDKEIREAWIEHQRRIDDQELRTYRYWAQENLKKHNLPCDEETVSAVADEAWRAVKKYGCDLDYVFGDGFEEVYAEIA